jgi:hypothetical protein
MNQINYLKLGLTIVLSLLITMFLTVLIGLAFMGSIMNFADEQTSKTPLKSSIIPQTVQQPSEEPKAAALPQPFSEPADPIGQLTTTPEPITNSNADLTAAKIPVQKMDGTLSASARETNIEICNFWKKDYEKSKSAAAKKFRREACERADMSYE